MSAVSLLAVALPAVAEQSGDFYYSVVGGTEVTLTGYAGAGGPLTLPSMIDGLPVTEIGYRAFFDRYELTGALVIPDSVVRIGESAFVGCTNLTGVAIGSGVQEIADGAFQNCRGFTGGVLIPDSVSRIGARAFLNCMNLTDLTLGSGVKEIGANAFGRCEALSGGLALPAGVTNIGAWAFDQCYNLTGDLVLPESLTTIGESAFFACRKLTGLKMGSAVTALGSAAFNNCAGLTGSVTIPDGVRNIGRSTFQLCTNLASVTVGSGVTNIGQQAFFANYNLKELYFKAAAPSLETNAFWVSPMTVYYVAGQPGWGAAIFGDRPTAVWSCTALFDAGAGTPSYGMRVYSVGNPYGELPAASRPSYVFAGWRTAADASGTWVTADSQVPYAIGSFSLFAAWATLSQTVAFDAQGGDATVPASKTVSFGLAYGTLPATSRAGYAFGGWRLNADGSGDEIADATLVASLAGHTLYAKWTANTYVVTFDVQAGNAPVADKTVTFGEAYGVLPVPLRTGYAFAGWWTGAGATGARITDGSPVTEASAHTLYAAWSERAIVTGMAYGRDLPDAFEGASKVTVRGLPAGLKYNAATKRITGVPTKAGTFNVVIAASGVAPQTFTITIVALPAWAQGVFNGYVEGGGLASMSVSALGKVTGKIARAGTNYTFSAASYAAGGSAEEGFEIAAVAKAGRTALALTLLVTQAQDPQALGVASGLLGAETSVFLYRDIWKAEAGALASFIGYYTAALPGNEVYGSGFLTFTVDKAGKVKTAGKLADGTAVSLSGSLIRDRLGRVFAVVYTAPAAYKGGQFFGLADFDMPGEDIVYLRPLDGTPFTWQSRSLQATETYGVGFARTTGLTGGWYSKTEDLAAYYADMDLTVGTDTEAPAPELTVGSARYGSLWWNPTGIALTPTLKTGVMAGLTAPAAGKPTDADKDGAWDYSAANSVGLKISLARPTGVFKGSFLAWFDYPVKKHVSKTLAFEGVLTPVRKDMDDGIGGRGFFLWPDKAVPPLPAKPYAFKWSYDFKILMTD